MQCAVLDGVQCAVCSVRQCGAKHKIYSAASNWQLDKPVLTPIVQPRAGVHGPGKYGPKIHGSEVYGPEMHGPGVYDPGDRVHDPGVQVHYITGPICPRDSGPQPWSQCKWSNAAVC